MSDDTTTNLHDTTDATVWADEFCKRWPTGLRQIEGKEGVETEENFRDIMIAWFANAIMAGVDSEARKHTDISREAVEGLCLVLRVNGIGPGRKNEELAIETLRALRDALDEAERGQISSETPKWVIEACQKAHRTGWDDAIEAAASVIEDERSQRGNTRSTDGMWTARCRIRALPYKPQEDVSDG